MWKVIVTQHNEYRLYDEPNRTLHHAVATTKKYLFSQAHRSFRFLCLNRGVNKRILFFKMIKRKYGKEKNEWNTEPQSYVMRLALNYTQINWSNKTVLCLTMFKFDQMVFLVLDWKPKIEIYNHESNGN